MDDDKHEENDTLLDIMDDTSLDTMHDILLEITDDTLLDIMDDILLDIMDDDALFDRDEMLLDTVENDERVSLDAVAVEVFCDADDDEDDNKEVADCEGANEGLIICVSPEDEED